MQTTEENSVIINIGKEQETKKPEKITFCCFRIGDSSSKAFVIRVGKTNQIFSIKEYISKSFEPKIIPRYLKLYVPIEEEIFSDDPNLSSLKKFNKARREGTLKLIELEKPLKKISDEPYLCNRTKTNPEALDIIILDDNLQRSIDNFVSNSAAELSFSKNTLYGESGSCASLSKEKLFQCSNTSTSNILSYDSKTNIYPNHKNSKFMKSIEKVEKKIYIKNKKVRISVLMVAVLAIILIIGVTWYPRHSNQ